MDKSEKCNTSDGSSNMYMLLGMACMPIALPFVALNMWKRFRARKYQNCLPGKVVLITGASSGLGEAIAHVFYRAGCKVILASRRIDELERVKRDLLNSQSNSVTYPPTILQLDLTELNSIPAFATKALSIHNHIDLLINNGGISVRADVLSTAVDVDLKVMLVNYFGTVALTKAILPSMLKNKEGHICFISSVQGKFALPYRSAYSASKHAVQAFADSLRAEVSHKGVSVSCISPGYIRTQLSMNALTASGNSYEMDKTTAAGMDPLDLATHILKAIMRGDKDVIVCDMQATAAYYLRVLCPSVYFWIMEQRAIKLEKAETAEEQKQK